MKEWNWFQNTWWILKEKVTYFLWILLTHKCEAKGCERRLKGKYRWCGLECYVYCGGSLKSNYKGETNV